MHEANGHVVGARLAGSSGTVGSAGTTGAYGVSSNGTSSTRVVHSKSASGVISVPIS